MIRLGRVGCLAGGLKVRVRVCEWVGGSACRYVEG